MAAWTTLMWRSWTSRMTQVPAWVRPMPMWCSRPLMAQGDGAGLVDAVVADPVVGVGVAVGPGSGFGHRVVERGGGGPVGQGAVRSAVVVLVDEGSRRAWSSAIVAGWTGWARSHFFMVCWNRSTLPQVVGWLGREFFWTMCRRRSSCLEAVAAAAAAGEADGVDHAVVGQRGGGDAVLGNGFAEGGEHDRGGDPGVGGDVQGVAGAVVEPADDLDVGAGSAVGSGEPVVGEVGLPGLVRHRGFEPDVGGLGSLLRLGDDQPGRGQVAADGRLGTPGVGGGARGARRWCRGRRPGRPSVSSLRSSHDQVDDGSGVSAVG